MKSLMQLAKEAYAASEAERKILDPLGLGNRSFEEQRRIHEQLATQREEIETQQKLQAEFEAKRVAGLVKKGSN